jgi:signal transduction histidine kinase/CheY-like chemotaxis protein
VRPLTPQIKERLARSLQYYWWPLNELQPLARETLADGVEKLTFPANSETAHGKPHEVAYLAQTRRLVDTPWHFTLLTPLQDLRRESMVQGILVGVAFALLAILGIAWNERRKVIATRLAAREALEEANSQLERRIAERTADLRASNERLKGQIRERRQAEQTLRHAQDELVQAGKLAAIGQMSTSIAHELNQPLAALRTLSGNTVRFLERGALETASTNLRTMNDLIDRMGRITASLRSFARRGDDSGQATGQGGGGHPAGAGQPHQCLPPAAAPPVRGPATGHRPDPPGADPGQPDRQRPRRHGRATAAELWLEGEVQGDKYRLQVRDNGHGIDAEARKHLFEPFFTTKPGEHGLGLGLTLSPASPPPPRAACVEHPATGGTAFVLACPWFPLANRQSIHEPSALTVLIVEDDPHVLLGCQQALALEDIACEGVGSAEEALERIGDDFAGIVVSDIRLPGIDGLELLNRLKARDRSLPVVLITGHGDIDMAVGAMRNGAYDFMEKPFSPSAWSTWCAARWNSAACRAKWWPCAASWPNRAAWRPHHRPLAGHGAPARTDRQRRRHLGQRADRRRDRHRQGAGRALPARLQPPPGPAVRGAELRRPAGKPVRKRDFRPRGQRLHRRRQTPHRQDRTRQRRHAVPR